MTDFCVDGFVAGREQLRSAQVEAEARMESSGRSLPTHKYLLAFDHATSSERFDNAFGPRKVQCLYLADREVLFITPPGRAVSVFNPGAAPKVLGSTRFDLRAIGIVTLAEFERGTTWEKLQDLLTNGNLEAAVEEEGKCRITWAYSLKPAGRAHRTVWFDKEKSYAPVRMELVVHVSNSDQARNEPAEWAVTSWAQDGPLWLPRKCEMHRRQPPANAFVELTWSSVNQPVSDLFKIDSFAPKDAFVNDYRFGSPTSFRLRDYQSSRLVETSSPVSWRIILVIGNVLFILVLAAFMIYRRRVRPVF